MSAPLLEKTHASGIANTHNYPWIAVVLATLMQAAEAWTATGVFTLYPFIQPELNLSQTQVGFITAAFMASGVFTAFPGGWLTDFWGVRRLVIICLAGAVLPSLGFSLMNSLWTGVVLALLVGTATGPIFPATSRAVMEWLPQKRRGLGMGIKQVGPPLSSGVAALLFPAIAMATSWRISILAVGGFVAFVAILTVAFYRDKPSSGIKAPRVNAKELLGMARDRALMVPALWATIFVGIQFAVISYFILFLVNQVGLSKVGAGSYLTIIMAVSIVGRVAWGAISDTILGGRRLMVLGILGASTVLVLVALAFIDEGVSTVFLVAVAVGVGLTVVAWMGIYTVLIGELAGVRRSGSAIGGAQVFMRAGMTTFPPAFGYMADASGSYALGWLVMAGLGSVATLGLLVFGKEQPRATT
jgi:ACS family hexuronate transporter-like MFS transporter